MKNQVNIYNSIFHYQIAKLRRTIKGFILFVLYINVENQESYIYLKMINQRRKKQMIKVKEQDHEESIKRMKEEEN